MNEPKRPTHDTLQADRVGNLDHGRRDGLQITQLTDADRRGQVTRQRSRRARGLQLENMKCVASPLAITTALCPRFDLAIDTLQLLRRDRISNTSVAARKAASLGVSFRPCPSAINAILCSSLVNR